MPRLYYKVIIAESIDAGIVLIGVNNPYVSINSIDEYILCPDISDKINYIGWDRKNITAGYSYACSVSDFVKKVTSLPQLPIVNNLLIWIKWFVISNHGQNSPILFSRAWYENTNFNCWWISIKNVFLALWFELVIMLIMLIMLLFISYPIGKWLNNKHI